MKALLVQYAARFDALSLRERLLVFAGCVAVTGLVLFAWLFDPIARERTQLTDRIGTQQRMLATTHAGVQSLLGNQPDPDATARAQRESLRGQRAAIDKELEGAARGLVAPERMALLLEALVRGEQRLQIVALRSLAPSPLLGAAPAQPEPGSPAAPQSPEKATLKPGTGTRAPAGDEPGIFKHGIELTVQGSYAELCAYVAKLERVPWRMYWARAALDASAYPRVGLTLTLYTLSLERSWLRL